MARLTVLYQMCRYKTKRFVTQSRRHTDEGVRQIIVRRTRSRHLHQRPLQIPAKKGQGVRSHEQPSLAVKHTYFTAFKATRQ
jgi:hypothetical protein